MASSRGLFMISDIKNAFESYTSTIMVTISMGKAANAWITKHVLRNDIATKSRHGANFVATGDTSGCHNGAVVRNTPGLPFVAGNNFNPSMDK